MSYSARVERWRDLVEQECQRIGTDISPNVVLAVIRQESNGTPGVVANVQAGDGSHAAGLMQTIQSVLDTYNANNGTGFTQHSLKGTSTNAARIQIRVGIWLLAHYDGIVRRWFNKRAIPLSMDDRIRFTDVAYAMGPGRSGGKRGLIPRLELLQSEGGPVTWERFEVRFERWGYSESKKRWINRPIHHANRTFARYSANEAEKPYPASYGGIEGPKPAGPALYKDIGTVLVVVAVIGILVWLYR